MPWYSFFRSGWAALEHMAERMRKTCTSMERSGMLVQVFCRACSHVLACAAHSERSEGANTSRQGSIARSLRDGSGKCEQGHAETKYPKIRYLGEGHGQRVLRHF